MAIKHRTNTVITFDGFEGEYLACPRINIWNDYEDRHGKGIAITVDHGATGLLLGRDGDGCQVQINGKVGWLTYYFVKELKDEWQTKQLNRQ